MKESTQQFQNECASLIPSYNLDYILNSDQTGCEYRINCSRTLTLRGQKKVEYTAQYTITASGKLLPKVFLCLQEQSGKFGVQVQTRVNELSNQFGNTVITCSKSGKLSANLLQDFVNNVLKPYVKDCNFLLLLDSWSGHKNHDMFNQFVNSDSEKTCQLKIIPPGCTPLVQPCDVYFYRQVKYFIKELQNSTYLLKEDSQISSRADAIKIHALIHNQLSAPAYQQMLKYAWFAAKLIEDRPFFQIVKQICFPPETKKKRCLCSEQAFVRCSWCYEFKCFECFYLDYHPIICKKYIE